MDSAQTPEQARKQRTASRQVERLAHYLTGPCGKETDDCFVRIPLSDGSSVSVTFERLNEDVNNGKPIPIGEIAFRLTEIAHELYQWNRITVGGRVQISGAELTLTPVTLKVADDRRRW